MGKGVAHPHRRGAPMGRNRRRRIRRLGPVGAGKAGHPAQQALGRAGFQQHGAICAPHDIGNALTSGLCRLGGLARQVCGHALHARRAKPRQRADAAGWRARRADRGAQIHHRLRMIAGPVPRCQPRGKRRQRGLGPGQRLGVGEEPGHDPFHIAIDHHRGFVLCDRGNCGGGIGANARQGAQPGLGCRKHPAMIGHNRAGTGQQVARAGIIAQPRPSLHHCGVGGCGQRRNIGPKRCKAMEIAAHRRHRGLLQHHLGQPDPIRVWALARRPVGRPHAPGQHAGVAVIPGQKGCTCLCVTQSLCSPAVHSSGVARPPA